MKLQQQNKSVMDQNEKYQYKFQYSLANYHPIAQNQPEEDNDFNTKDQLTVLRRSNQLIDFSCFKNKQIQNLMKTLFTHYLQIYANIAVRLYRICQMIYRNTNMSSSSFIRNYQELIQTERQKLSSSLKDLCQIINDQKQKYFKIVALCIASSIFKILTLQKEIQDLDLQTVFHTVYWQTTGVHSSSQLLKKILIDTFHQTNFHNYLVNQQPPVVYKIKTMAQSLVKNSQSSKNIALNNSMSFINNSMSFSNSSMNFSIKDTIKQSHNQRQKYQLTFSKQIKRKQKFNKQNQGLSSNYPTNSTNINFQNMKPNSNKSELNNKQVYENCKTQQNINKQQSSRKLCNFKKDRTGIFENYSKSKSNNKIMNQLGSQNKKTNFASYLQQKKKLSFQ